MNNLSYSSDERLFKQLIRAGWQESPVQTQMARRKFRSNQRHEPSTERSLEEYFSSIPAPQTSRTEVMRMVRGGEDTFLELKVKLSNTEKIAQEIVALANTGGGLMVFGVNDQMRVEVDNEDTTPLSTCQVPPEVDRQRRLANAALHV